MMYQQSNPYSNDGATKVSGAGVGGGAGMNGGNNMNGNGAAYGSAYGFGAGGYGGAAGYGGGNSMYGGGSAYGTRPVPGGVGQQGSMYGAGSMTGEMNENIIVTKLFSSRRDLDRVASAVDFSRRFDSNWGSYRSAGADGYGGSIYGNSKPDAGSLMNFGGSRDVGSMTDRGIGAVGMGPDGGAAESAEEVKEAKETKAIQLSAIAKAPRETLAEASKSEPSAMTAVETRPAEPPANVPVMSRATATTTTTAVKTPPTVAEVKKPVEAKPILQPESPAVAAEPIQHEPTHPIKAEERQPPQKSPGRVMQAREVVPAVEKPREAPPIDDIPLLADDVLPKKAPTPSEMAPRPPQPEKSSELVGAAKTSMPETAAPLATQKAPVRGNENTRPMRPRSRPQSRPQSRMTSMSVVEFPQADEVKDEMVADGLKDPEKEAALAAAREEQKRQREEANRQARLERAKLRQAQEDLQKQRDEEARRAREAKAEEERQKKELVAKMDEETRKERAAVLAARERQREEEKRRFEEAKKAEEEKEAARAQAAIAERQRQLAEREAQEKEAAQEKTSRPASRPRSRRPISRLSSNLRGAIPEQPPDVVAGQIKDTLADENLGKPMHTSAARNTPVSDIAVVGGSRNPHRSGEHGHTPGSLQQQAATPVVSAGSKQRVSREPMPASPPSGGSKNTPASQQQATPAVQKELNMVKTFVLVEQVRKSNHAVQYTPESITYRGQTIKVTELKTREEDNFNYNSTVVHDVREAACRGFNAAVLSMDTVNTAGRFDSPVWSILNRVVRTLLKENSNEAGGLRENFELTCAIGYLYHDKVRDMLAHEGEAQFTKVAVNPSPIYGPRLTNLKYETVTDPFRFEEMLSTTLSQGAQDPTFASLTEGVVAAFVLVKQTRETEGKPDIYLSSFIVASSGEDPVPYQSAISHTRNEYATVFHLVLGGPSCTCFMLNVADDDTVRKSGDANRQPVPESINTAMTLLAQMASLQNYDLRSGSVKRFIKYVERSHTNAKQRLAKEQDESQRRKVERYLKEQERLLDDAYSLLRDANIRVDEEL